MPSLRETCPPDPASLAFALGEAARVVASVMDGRSLTEALARCWQAHAGLAGPARGAIQDLAYGALRRYGLGDFLLAQLVARPPRDASLHALLLAALYRLDLRPEDAHTTVDQAVHAAAGIHGGRYRGLTNGVLRNYLRRRTELGQAALATESARWCHPEWWIRRLRVAHPAHWEAILAAGNGHPPMALRVNRRRVSLPAYLALLAEAGIAARPLGDACLLLERPLAVERLPGFGEGMCSVQDAAAQRAAVLLGAADGMRVLDACAAPGGKAAHIAERADVELLALDADAGRALRVSETLLRLGLPPAPAGAAASSGWRVAVADCRETDAWWDGRPFDRVLADVPCSASGVVRRHPDIKWLRRERDLASFARVQAHILDALWRVLAPGGKLLYATCSVFPEENDRQIAAFAARQEDCARLPIGDALDLQLLPTDEHDGFFYALLEKQA